MSEPDPLDPSATVADTAPFFAAWRSWSDAVRPSLTVRDVPYGPTAEETLDLAVPRVGAPLIVFFHGGYWRRLHKDDSTYVVAGFRPHDLAVAVVNYALAPAVTLEEIVAQARRSLRWLRERAGGYGVDASRIVVCGHSAGGHLAAMCAVDAPVRAVASISGLHDLRPLVRSFAQPWLQLDEARAAALSPALLAPAAPTRVLAATGECETAAFRDQGRALPEAWRRHRCETHYEEPAGDDHFTIVSRLHDPDDALTARIAALAHGP